ncbi:MAG TPA: tRNA lysidine(34) synthetase TilS [Pyrinomonadaceae bacterium]|nr:tRNA lysidine(34) synthetase TilS [Pyrinomonadaceae bacterium]
MQDFTRNLITEWRRLELPFSGETFVVAVSGGADSISLVLALNDLKKRRKLDHRFIVAHFNHKLRDIASDEDEDFVRRLAIEHELELAVGHGIISKQGNLEQNARNARYEFLARIAENAGAFAVLTGHTVNDQAETFLLNLLRGAGPDGLSGMQPVRILESGMARKGEGEAGKSLDATSPLFLIRPLLTWAKRRDTESYCHELGFEYRYDTMNEDIAFKRVRIRKLLVPMLEDFNPKIVETLAKTASLMRDSRDAENGSNRKDEKSGELRLRNLKSLSKTELYGLLRSWLERQRGNLRGVELKHIEAIERLIHSRKGGKTVELPDRQTVVKQAGTLRFEDLKVEKSASEH